MSGMISGNRLVNLATPDQNIQDLQSSSPRLYQAIKNLGTSSQQLIASTFPKNPQPLYRARIIIPGTPAVATDILAHKYQVILPTDPSGYWTFNSITLTGCTITCKTTGSVNTTSIDILVNTNKDFTTFKSIFQTGFNPMLPVGVYTTHNVMFGINTLSQGNIGRVDVLTSDPDIVGLELVLTGYYNLTQVSVP